MAEKRKILVVENEIPMAMLMAHLLLQTGHEFETAHSLAQGMVLARECQFDLIILDTDLPGFNFFDVCLDLRERHISRQTPIILLAENPTVNDEVWGVDYVTKPLAAADFIFEVTSHLVAKSAALLPVASRPA